MEFTAAIASSWQDWRARGRGRGRGEEGSERRKNYWGDLTSMASILRERKQLTLFTSSKLQQIKFFLYRTDHRYSIGTEPRLPLARAIESVRMLSVDHIQEFLTLAILHGPYPQYQPPRGGV